MLSQAIIGICIGFSLFLVAATLPVTNPTQATKSQEELVMERIDYYSNFYAKWKYPYVWGGYNPLTSFDCSGYTYWCYHIAGVPVVRLNALRMWLDRGGWPGVRITAEQGATEKAQFPNPLFWDYARPKQHVGLCIINATNKEGKRSIVFREASSSKKIVQETSMVKNDFRWKKLSGIIQVNLTVGSSYGRK